MLPFTKIVRKEVLWQPCESLTTRRTTYVPGADGMKAGFGELEVSDAELAWSIHW